MKLYRAFLIFILFISKSFSIDENLPNEKSLFKVFMNFFKVQYSRTLNTNYIVKYHLNNCREYSNNDTSFKICRKTKTTNNKITDTLSYHSESNRPIDLKIIRYGINLQSLNNEKLFSFDFPVPGQGKENRITYLIPPLGILIDFKRGKHEDTYLLQANVEEIKVLIKAKKYGNKKRDYIFSCTHCTPNPLQLSALEDDFSDEYKVTKYYYQSFEMAPSHFYQKISPLIETHRALSQYYLVPLFFFEYNWPQG